MHFIIAHFVLYYLVFLFLCCARWRNGWLVHWRVLNTFKYAVRIEWSDSDISRMCATSKEVFNKKTFLCNVYCLLKLYAELNIKHTHFRPRCLSWRTRKNEVKKCIDSYFHKTKIYSYKLFSYYNTTACLFLSELKNKILGSEKKVVTNRHQFNESYHL